MEINYQLSDRVFCRLKELRSVRRMRKMNYYYATAGLPVIAISAGVFILFATRQWLFGLWVVLMAGSFLARVKTFGRFYQDVFYPPGMDETARQVILTLTPEGLVEKTGGVTSFAPWSAVTGTDLMEDLLVISLASNQVVVIPGDTVQQPSPTPGEIKEAVTQWKAAFQEPDSAAGDEA
jgi:hypothetical protein